MKLTSRTFDPFRENQDEKNHGYCVKGVSHVSFVITLVYRFACLNFQPAARGYYSTFRGWYKERKYYLIY